MEALRHILSMAIISNDLIPGLRAVYRKVDIERVRERKIERHQCVVTCDDFAGKR